MMVVFFCNPAVHGGSMNDLFPPIRCGLNDIGFLSAALEHSGLFIFSADLATNDLGAGRSWEIEFFNQPAGWSHNPSKTLPWPVVAPAPAKQLEFLPTVKSAKHEVN